MTWTGEVAHVAWKDVRQQRWLVLAYVVLVAVATGRATILAHGGTTPGALMGIMMLVVIVGCFLSAIIMQTDSPSRADAFWVTRPFHASAVLVAKTVVIGSVVVGLALLGELIGLSNFDLSSSSISGMLFACFATYSIWLLLSMLLGAATRDLRSWVVGFIVVLVATALMGGLFGGRVESLLLRSGLRWLFFVLGMGGALVTLVTLYARRGRALQAWAAACLTTACAFMAAFSPPAQMPGKVSSETAGPLQLSVHDESDLTQTGRLTLSITAPATPESLAADFVVSRIVVHLRDGPSVTLQRGVPDVQLHLVNLPTAGDVRWLAQPPTFTRSTDRFQVELTGREMSLLARGVSDVEVNGIVSLKRPHAVAMLPLSSGAEIRSAGRDTRIAGVNETPSGYIIDLTSVGLQTQSVRDMPFISTNGLSFALVNDQRREAIPLQSRGSGSNSDWLVLPGTSLLQSTFRLETFLRSAPGPTQSISPDWYRGSRLLVAAWETENSYPATIRTKLD